MKRAHAPKLMHEVLFAEMLSFSALLWHLLLFPDVGEHFPRNFTANAVIFYLIS
jgi:hypothetical protein